MTPEQREAILENEKKKFRRLKIVVAAVLIPLVLGYLLFRIQIGHEVVAGTMESVSVTHKATGTKVLVLVNLDRGDTAEVLLPVTLKFVPGKRLEVTETTSIFGTRKYVYPRAL